MSIASDQAFFKYLGCCVRLAQTKQQLHRISEAAESFLEKEPTFFLDRELTWEQRLERHNKQRQAEQARLTEISVDEFVSALHNETHPGVEQPIREVVKPIVGPVDTDSFVASLND